jgi:hypothetical protein
VTPFLLLRRWHRRASAFERRSAYSALFVVVALLALALQPTGDSGSDEQALSTTGQPAAAASQSAGGATTAGAPATEGAEPVPGTSTETAPAGSATSPTGAAASGDGIAASGATGGAAAAGGDGCGPVAEGVRGVSDSEIQVAYTLLDLAGPIGNGAVGVESPEKQKQQAEAVAAAINKAGGVRCRKLVVKTYSVNPLDQNQQQSTCLRVIQERNFAVLDSSGYTFPPSSKDCFLRQGVPYVGFYGPLPGQERQYGKFLFSIDAPVAKLIRTSILAMKGQGFYDPAKGFKKLGLFVEDCVPELIDLARKALGEVGVAGSAIDTFEFGCPTTGFAAPNSVAQAVTQHRLAGVTHVIPITGSGSFSNYTKIAQQQNFHPRYTVLDYQGLPATSETQGTGPDPSNFDGSIMASLHRWGEYNVDLPPSPGAARCSQQLQSVGQPPMTKANRNVGGACNLLNLFAAMASKTPTLSQSTLGDGNAGIGRFEAAFPSGDGVFDRAGKHSGGDFYRFIQWQAACYCWKPLDRDFRPAP